MYGSDNQSSSKSVSGSLSPPWDDSGQRSYSMTTCGSKSYTLPRNHDLRLPLDCHPGAQRPRSPYPYPTRLPRPGIRPSSPALTENGIVDYSRMVEIDRFPQARSTKIQLMWEIWYTNICPQRTCHHPHKTLFPYKTAREEPRPLSMRYGVNQSTRSISDERGPARPLLPSMSRRPPLPNDVHPWGLRPRERLRSGSSGQSLRTVSLSSTSGVYNCAAPHARSLQIPKQNTPIFYDYSEDFENAVDPPPDFPIANPTPLRVSKSFCPGTSNNDGDDSSESADEEVGHVVDYLQRVTMIESADEQDKNNEGYRLEQDRPVSRLSQTKCPSQASYDKPVEETLGFRPIVPRSVHVLESSDVSTALEDRREAVAESQVHNLGHAVKSNENCLASEASTIENPLDPETPHSGIRTFRAGVESYNDENHSHSDEHDKYDSTQDDESLDDVLEQRTELIELRESVVRRPELMSSASATLPGRYSSGRKDNQFYSLSSGLSDLASFVKYVDHHMQNLDSSIFEQCGTTVPESGLGIDSGRIRECDQAAQEQDAPPRKSSLAHYRRSYVGCKVNTSASIDELQRYQVVSTRSGPTLVPQPISPAKMLRVKNSIPQLMKALPPLPGYSPASESPFNPTIVPVEFEPFEFSRLTDARSTLIEPFGSERQDKQTSQEYDTFSFDRGGCKPKLKLKDPRPLVSGNIRRLRSVNRLQTNMSQLTTSEKRYPTTPGEYSTAPVKRRLPIKVSRPMLDSMGNENTGTVNRRPGVGKSSTISELASSQPVDLFSTSKVLEMAVVKAGPCFSEPSYSSNKKHETVLVIENRPKSKPRMTTVDEGRGVSLDAHLDALRPPRAINEEAAEDEMRSFFSDSLIKPRRGLRKKLSNLKSRLLDPRHQMPSTMNDVVHEDNLTKVDPGVDARAPNAFRDPLTDMNPAKTHNTVLTTRTVRSKLEKLVRGVKYRIRTWGKHKFKDDSVDTA